MLRVGASGDEFQGPPHGVAASFETTVGAPLTLLLSATDKPLTTEEEQRGGDDDDDADDDRRPRRPPLSVTWKKFRGPGDVTFEAEGIDSGDVLTHPFDDLSGGETVTSVTFSEPGQYRLTAIGNDDSAAPGDGSTRQCCWTTTHVDVTVGP